MTVEEFLDYEDGSDCLHEYFHGEMFTMEDTSYAHEQIIARLGNIRPTGAGAQGVRSPVRKGHRGGRSEGTLRSPGHRHRVWET